MRQKIALAVASAAAATTLSIAIAAAGMAPRTIVPASAVPASTAGTVAASPRVQVDTVYLKPAPSQQTITIQQPAAGGTGEGGDDAGGSDD
jgi:hypothetical protein